VGEVNPDLRKLGLRKGFEFGVGRDAIFEGTCDDGVLELCKKLGWEEELNALVSSWVNKAEDAGPAIAEF